MDTSWEVDRALDVAREGLAASGACRARERNLEPCRGNFPKKSGLCLGLVFNCQYFLSLRLVRSHPGNGNDEVTWLSRNSLLAVVFVPRV